MEGNAVTEIPCRVGERQLKTTIVVSGDHVQIGEVFFSRADLLGLPNFAIVGRLLVDDAPRTPFLFNTAWRPRPSQPEWAECVRVRSRERLLNRPTR